MKIIAGLGNPGMKYATTRHNVGFQVIDELARRNQINIGTEKFKALVGKGLISGQQVMLVKPLTYMNLSGESIVRIVDYFQIEPEDVLVVFDDISLEPGQLRIRGKGSAGGHNGIKSIIAELGSSDFPRVKVGIGDPGSIDLVDYVLGHFQGDEVSVMENAYVTAAQAVEAILQDGLEKSMNIYNRKPERSKP